MTRSKTPDYYNGILAHKDLSNRSVQGGIRSILEYYTNQEEIDYKWVQLETKKKRSVFLFKNAPISAKPSSKNIKSLLSCIK